MEPLSGEQKAMLAVGESKAAQTKAMKAEPDAFKTLDDFVGVEEIKQRFKEIITTGKFMDERRRRGLKTKDPVLNMVLEGPPGAGKTESAKALGQMLFEAGVLPGKDGQAIFNNQSPGSLKGAVVGESEKNIIEAFEASKGGVLFIDEANAWLSPQNTYGVAALQTLMKLTSDNPNDVVVILAGYGGNDETVGLREGLALVDPGLPRRFPELVNYRELTGKEKAELSVKSLKQYDYKPTPTAKKQLARAMDVMQGQGGDVMTFNALLQNSIGQRYSRAKKPEQFDMQKITPADVAYAVKRYRDEFGDPLQIPEEAPRAKVVGKPAKRGAGRQPVGAK